MKLSATVTQFMTSLLEFNENKAIFSINFQYVW